MKQVADINFDISYTPVGQFENTRFEKIHNVVFDNSIVASAAVAREIATLIKSKAQKGEPCVLGLATGSSPVKVYDELIRLHKQEGLSFKNVITFNLDEYFPMKKDDEQSYYHFMHQHLFNHVDILPVNINVPNGEVSTEDIETYCKAYEDKITKVGGIDFQLLGIGRTGHIGFNEPGSHYNSATREVTLNHLTRFDAVSAFYDIENVPRHAITMGIGTILRKAKRIVLMAWGQNKSQVIKMAVEGDITSKLPASYLQEHENVTFVLDKEAAELLTRIDRPWIVSPCIWTDKLTHKAVVWLSEHTKKPVLQLTDSDYNENGMSDLLKNQDSYTINIRTFNRLQHTITGWPGGKPKADDTNRPERSMPECKRVIIFSPHPDDDVISMGGTFDRLVSQGHDVHVVYQTSGNIAVADHEAIKIAEIANTLAPSKNFEDVLVAIRNKKPGAYDAPEVRRLKGNIRRSESLGATRYIGIPDQNVHFLDLPFYETGAIKKKPLGRADIDIMNAIIEKIKPHQIYAAGDLADPHGTHRVCLDALFVSLKELKTKPFAKDCWVWLYRGAWHEWDTYDIEMAVPMSPLQVLKKRKAIFFHQSQKDGVMFQGEDHREFWVRAEDRNRETANRYSALGLANYAAMEAFVRYHF